VKDFIKRANIATLSLIALGAISLSVAKFFDLFSHYLSTINYPLVTLTFLGLISLHLIATHLLADDARTEATNSFNALLKAVGGHSAKAFADSAQLEKYLGARILEAKSSICDTTWKVRISEEFSSAPRKNSHAYLDDCIQNAAQKLAYREIFVLNDIRRIEKLRRRLIENAGGYSCRYFREDSQIPRLQFVLIDEDEAIFFASARSSLLCAIRSPELTKVLKSYFDEAWEKATPIKDGETIHQGEVAEIEKRASQLCSASG
jgi:hypothetical protein